MQGRWWSSPARAGVLWLLAAAVLGELAGCSVMRRDSLRAIDPALQQQPRLERERVRHGFRLGPYTVVQRSLHERADGETAVTIDGPRHPSSRWDLELELTIDRGGAPWRTRCIGRRQANVDADYGVIAGVANDSVSIECDIEREQSRWHFFAAGRLDGNFAGELHPVHLEKERGGRLPEKERVDVEVLLWFKRVKLIPRHLAEPVAQVRHGRKAFAAMVLSRPEWAWVHPAEGGELRGVAMATLAAIRLMPLGLDE